MSLLAVSFVLFAFLSVSLLVHGDVGTFITYSHSGRNNMLWIPSVASNSATFSTPLPLFVMLHGCSQTPAVFATATKMNTHCDNNNCYVLYIEQPSSSNNKMCWNWFANSNQKRGQGEPDDIAKITQSIMTSGSYSIDSDRVFVGGLSAGGAMAVIMGATYPDIFRGIVSSAGMEYHAAISSSASYVALKKGGPSPSDQGTLAYKAAGGGHHRKIAVLVIQGSEDTTTYPVNAGQVVSQWVKTLDLVFGHGRSRGYMPSTATNVTTVPSKHGDYDYTISTYNDTLYGDTLITSIMVDGMGHAWSGGDESVEYTDAKGPDASSYMINYFYNFANSNTSMVLPNSAVSFLRPAAHDTYTLVFMLLFMILGVFMH